MNEDSFLTGKVEDALGMLIDCRRKELWEKLQHLQLANSTWTQEQIAYATIEAKDRLESYLSVLRARHALVAQPKDKMTVPELQWQARRLFSMARQLMQRAGR